VSFLEFDLCLADKFDVHTRDIPFYGQMGGEFYQRNDPAHQAIGYGENPLIYGHLIDA